MSLYRKSGGGGGGTGDTNSIPFTTNGSGAATVAGLIGKTPGTNLWLWENADDGAGTLLGIDLYTFNAGTGAFSGLTASTKYLALYE